MRLPKRVRADGRETAHLLSCQSSVLSKIVQTRSALSSSLLMCPPQSPSFPILSFLLLLSFFLLRLIFASKHELLFCLRPIDAFRTRLAAYESFPSRVGNLCIKARIQFDTPTLGSKENSKSVELSLLPLQALLPKEAKPREFSVHRSKEA